MKTLRTLRSRRGGCLILLLCALGLSHAVSAVEGEGIIDEIRIDEDTVRIEFTEAAQYVGHTPKESGDKLYIDLNLSNIDKSDSASPQQQQQTFKPTNNLPLTLVSYRKEGRKTTKAQLELRFTKSVDYDVATRSDFRGITVTVYAGPKTMIKGSAPVEAKANEMMDLARKALIDEKDPKKASLIYQEVLNLPEHSAYQEALEFLGVALERRGSLKSAQNVYKKYLKLYPKGDDAERVRQRLVSLQTATSKDKRKLRKAENRSKQDAWQFYGGLGQYYAYDAVDIKTDVSTVKSKAKFLQTDFDFNVRYRTDATDSRFRLNVGHDANLDDKTNDSSVRYLYFEHNARKLGLLTRIGRQASSRDGVNSRFDGARLSYAITQEFKLTAVAGSPVDSVRDPVNDQRSFAGIALDLGPYFGNTEFTIYGLDQKLGELTDRQSVGGEVRYYTPELTVFGMYDYDSFYNDTNVAMLMANWNVGKWNLNASYNKRKAPFLTTNTAFTSSGLKDIKELQALLTPDQIYQRAQDLTGETQTTTFGASYPMGKKVRVYADVTVSNSSSTSGSTVAGIPTVAAQEASGDEYYYSLRAVGNGLFKDGLITTLGFREFDGKVSSSSGSYFSIRMRIKKKWLIYPTLQYTDRYWKTTKTTQSSVATRVRAEYAWKDNVSFEAELGLTTTDETIPDDPIETTIGNYFSLGYRYNF